MTKRASIEAGWRFIDTDYKTGENADRSEWNVLAQRQAVGFAFRF